MVNLLVMLVHHTTYNPSQSHETAPLTVYSYLRSDQLVDVDIYIGDIC